MLECWQLDQKGNRDDIDAITSAWDISHGQDPFRAIISHSHVVRCTWKREVSQVREEYSNDAVCDCNNRQDASTLVLELELGCKKTRQKFNNTLAQCEKHLQVKRADKTYWSPRRDYLRCRRTWLGARNRLCWSWGSNRVRICMFTGGRLEATEPTSQTVSLLGSKWEICFKLSLIPMTIYNSNLVSILL